jgi:hypothetical protein
MSGTACAIRACMSMFMILAVLGVLYMHQRLAGDFKLVPFDDATSWHVHRVGLETHRHWKHVMFHNSTNAGWVQDGYITGYNWGVDKWEKSDLLVKAGLFCLGWVALAITWWIVTLALLCVQGIVGPCCCTEVKQKIQFGQVVRPVGSGAPAEPVRTQRAQVGRVVQSSDSGGSYEPVRTQ